MNSIPTMKKLFQEPLLLSYPKQEPKDKRTLASGSVSECCVCVQVEPP